MEKFNPSNGLINGVLNIAGIGNQPFLTSTGQALPALIAMTLWQQVGFGAILFLAGLQGLPAELTEAARIDGATRRQVLWNVTIPLLSRTTLFVVVIMTVFSLQAFAPAFLMTQGGPANSTSLIVFYIYQQAFQFSHYGYAAAMASFLVAVLVCLTGILFVVTKGGRFDFD